MKRSGPPQRKTPLRPGKPLRAKTQLQRGKALTAKTAGLKRSGPIRKKPLHEQSQRKQDDRAAFEASKLVVARRSGKRCEYQYPHSANNGRMIRCQHDVQDYHHISRQSQGHDHAPSNLLGVCRWHHDYIHDHIEESRALGYLSPAKRGNL